MQTTPTAATSLTGQAVQPNGGAKAGDGSIFAALIQALTGVSAAAAATTGTSGGQASDFAETGNAAPTDGEAQAVEPGEAGEADPLAMTQLPGLQLPLRQAAVLALSPAAEGASTTEGMAGAQPAAAVPQSAAAPVATILETQAAPHSAQAVELAKLLGAGAQVHVTTEAAAPTPPPAPPVNAVAVAAALEAAPVAAAVEPIVRAAAAEPGKQPQAAKVPEPADGAPAKAVPTPTAAAMPGGAKHQAPTAAPVQPAADANPAPPAPPSSPGPASPAAGGGAEAPAPEPSAAASGREVQIPASQAPAFASSTSAQPAAAASERADPPVPAPPPAGQVSVHIAKAARAGVDRIDIRLAPASLGRVEISLDLGDSQQVRATISAETKEALELLRADARLLERALNDAGLKTDASSLSFQLRDQGQRAGQDGGSRHGYATQPQDRMASADGEGGTAEPSPRPAPPSPRGDGRIDIHA